MMELVRKITTRREAAEELIDLGVHGIALDIALKAGAPRRHRDRVELINHQLDHDLQKRFGENACYEMIRNWSVGLCAMELTTSVAARKIAKVSRTERTPYFKKFGTGRREAIDGPAWTAAIEEAMFRIADLREYYLCPGVEKNEDPASVPDSYLPIGVGFESDPENDIYWIPKMHCEGAFSDPRCAQENLMRHAVIVAGTAMLIAITGGEHGITLCSTDMHCPLPVKGSPEEWARIVNYLRAQYHEEV